MFSKRVLLVGSYKLKNVTSVRLFNSKQENHDLKKENQIQKTYEKTINQVTLLGRVGADPLKKGSHDHPAVVFSLATHNNYKYENGEFVEKTDWHRVCVFKPALRELVFGYLRKGMRIHITGKIAYGSVTEGEVTKAVTSIIADDVIFLHHDGNG